VQFLHLHWGLHWGLGASGPCGSRFPAGLRQITPTLTLQASVRRVILQGRLSAPFDPAARLRSGRVSRRSRPGRRRSGRASLGSSRLLATHGDPHVDNSTHEDNTSVVRFALDVKDHVRRALDERDEAAWALSADDAPTPCGEPPAGALGPAARPGGRRLRSRLLRARPCGQALACRRRLDAASRPRFARSPVQASLSWAPACGRAGLGLRPRRASDRLPPSFGPFGSCSRVPAKPAAPLAPPALAEGRRLQTRFASATDDPRRIFL
jgi:hypothetical protein